jgi:uncharacterized protein YqjF (DUF2071 family)
MKFLTAKWQNLILANYEIDGDVLTPFVPKGLELDSHEGHHFVSLVGFQFIDTRVLGMKWPGLHSFVELNLRFYVKRAMPDGDIKRGVVFIKEIVPSALIAFVARTIYHEPYERWDVTTIPDFGDASQYGYTWNKNGPAYSLRVTADDTFRELKEASHEQFIAEHYWGYTKLPNKTNEYEVEHPPWKYREVTDHTINCDFSEVYGATWSFLSDSKPYSIFLAEGSDISVSPKQSF